MTALIENDNIMIILVFPLDEYFRLLVSIFFFSAECAPASRRFAAAEKKPIVKLKPMAKEKKISAQKKKISPKTKISSNGNTNILIIFVLYKFTMPPSPSLTRPSTLLVNWLFALSTYFAQADG